MHVEVVKKVDEQLVAAFRRLIPQLSRSAGEMQPETLMSVVASPSTTLYVAINDDGIIVGSLTLALFQIPTGLRAWIEDVVVDSAARGQGVGELLTRQAIEDATTAGARTVDLTSSAAREPARRMYRRIGFHERDTLVFRYDPSTHEVAP